jgi:CheY-like chemotaxis protein
MERLQGNTSRDKTLESVLYVDDDQTMRELVGIAFGVASPARLRVCKSGLEALDEVVQRLPSLIILDVQMPGMDGPTTLLALRAIPGMEKVPVIFFTSAVNPEQKRRYLALGAIGVIPKPVDGILSLPKIVNLMWMNWMRNRSHSVIHHVQLS